jgi:hypothetical protein
MNTPAAIHPADHITMNRQTWDLIGSFLEFGGLLLAVAWMIYALPLCSLFAGQFGGIGTYGHLPDGGIEFVIMHKWHLTSSQFDGYALSVLFSIVFAKFGSWGMFLGYRIKRQSQTIPVI